MRNIPPGMVDDFAGDATSFCRLIKIITKDGTRLAYTTLDADLAFDDLVDSLVYRAMNGLQPSSWETTGDLSVDNAEMLGWIEEGGITEQQIRAGLFNHAKVVVYKVNFLNATPGRCVIEQAGRCGETEFTESSWRTEFRSKLQQIKQPVGALTSLTCRLAFGSPGCGKTFVWTSGEVTAVDPLAPDQVFTGDVTTEPAGGYALGVVEMLSGDNAGVELEVELFDSGEVTLEFPLPYPAQPGDLYRIRQDCDKTLAYCGDVHDNVRRMEAEPYTPVADGVSAQIPGAAITSPGGGDNIDTSAA